MISARDYSQGAISFINNPITLDHSKHMDVMHHFVQEKEQYSHVSFKYCPTESMIVGMLTKPLSEAQFVWFQLSMGVHSKVFVLVVA